MHFDSVIKGMIKGNYKILIYYDLQEKIILAQYIKDKGYLKQVLDNCFSNLTQSHPDLAFYLVYDLTEYQEYAQLYLTKDLSVLFNIQGFISFLGSTPWSIEFVIHNLNSLIPANPELVFVIIKYAITNKQHDLLQSILYNENLQIRGQAMVEVLDNFPYLFLNYYPDVISSMIKRDTEGQITDKLDEQIASHIAYLIADQNIDINLFNQVKEFIFANYPTNSLAAYLLGDYTELGLEPSPHYELLKDDATRYFLTSKKHKYELYKWGAEYIDSEIILPFQNKISRFIDIDESIVEHIFLAGLGDKFLQYIETYLEKSTGAKVIQDLGRGSCTRAFRVGDFVIKCSSKKWRYEGWPDNFLFAKCYEQDYVKNNLGNVTGALEVQEYYCHPVKLNERALIDNFFRTALQNGYTIDETINGYGQTPNLFHLDSYLDANCDDPESLPEWFKKEPVTWIDIDLIHHRKKY